MPAKYRPPVRAVLAGHRMCALSEICESLRDALVIGRVPRHVAGTMSGDGTMSKLYFSYATMNAGKSTLLLQAAYNYQERGMRVVMLIAAFDDRAGQGRIASRIGLESEAIPFRSEDDLHALIERLNGDGSGEIACVFVDEAQFLGEDQVWQLARVADRLGIPVMAYGLRTDFQGKLFPGSMALLAIADELREVRTICHCGRKATMVVRLDGRGKVMRGRSGGCRRQ